MSPDEPLPENQPAPEQSAPAEQWPDPVFTFALIAANIAIWLLMLAKGTSFWTTDEFHALKWGADFAPLTLGVRFHQFWRLFTSNFIHLGFVHLAVNMLFLWALGRFAEYFYTSRDFLLLYGFAGLCSGLLGVIWEPGATSAGASGAIFGISGALMTTLLLGNLDLTKDSKEKLLSGVVQFTVLNLFAGGIQNYLTGIFHSRVDNAGHIGGLLSGLLIGAVFANHLSDTEKDRKYRGWAWVLLYFGFFLLLVTAFYYYNGVTVDVQRGLPAKH